MVKIQIYILSRDRPDYLREALDSVLISSNGLADIVVSDNSETDTTQTLLFCDYSNIKYVRRYPPVSVFEHFRLIIEESLAEYIVLFHDDDLMMPNYVKTMLESLDKNPDIAAVGCNAFLMRDNKKNTESFMGSVEKPLLLLNKKELISKYLKISNIDVAPFSSYMYRKKYLLGLYLDPAQGGKHADVSFLLKVIHRRPILWMNQPLMWYRRHSANDSRLESISDRLSLLRYIFKHTAVRRTSSDIQEYKFKYWVLWWLQRPNKQFLRLPSTWRERIVIKFVILSSFKYALTKSFIWQKLLKKAFFFK